MKKVIDIVLHRQKQITGVIGILAIIVLLASTIMLTAIVLQYGPVAPVLRYIGIALLFIMLIGFTYLLIHLLTKKKLWPKLLIIVIILLCSSAEFYLNYVLERALNSIDQINKDTLVYSTHLLSLKTSNIVKVEEIKDKKIAIINNKDAVDGYQISKDVIDEYKLEENNTLVEYEDYPSMVKDLYNDEIDVIFIPSKTYNSLAENKDETNLYQDIIDETNVVLTRTKEVEKDESEYVEFSITKPFTVLLMGVDTISDDIKNSSANGDSLMLITFNPNTLNATVLSIPRDTYVPITCLNNKQNKITHAGWYGEKCMEQTIEKFTGIDIEYYVKVDFKAVVDLVDHLGGIDVNVPQKIVEQDSNRKWGKNTITIEKGMQHLNGEQALALARHRKTLINGDIGRGQNQQLVIKGILNELKNIRSVDTLLDLLDTIEKHMDTNFTRDQILSFYDIGIAVLENTSEGNDPINMQQLYLNGYDRYIYETSLGFALYNYVYYSGSLDDVTKAMRVNLELESPTPITEFTFSANEKYSLSVIGKNNTYTDKVINVLPSFIGKSKTDVLSWANKNNINVTFNTIDSSSSEHIQDEVMTQSYPAYYKLSDIPSSGIEFTVVNKVGIIETPTPEPEIDCTLEENINLPICQIIVENPDLENGETENNDENLEQGESSESDNTNTNEG